MNLALFAPPEPSIEGIDAAGAFGAYSADVIAMHTPSKVRKPVWCNGYQWVNVGMRGGGNYTRECSLYRLLPLSEFVGEKYTYHQKTAIWREGDQYPGDFARNDPMGFYHGMVVKRGAETFAISGPEFTLQVPRDEAQRIDAAEVEQWERDDDADEEADAAAAAEGFDFDGEDEDDDLGDFGEFDDGGRTRIGNTPDDGEEDGLCECGRVYEDCATFDDPEAPHADRDITAEVAGELGTDGTAEDEAAYLYESAKLPHNTNPACLVCFRQLKGRKAIHSTLTRCGVICDGLCLQIHLRKCETCACAEAVEEIPVDCRGAYLDALGTLPGFEHVAEERAAAAAEAEGEMLSLDFSRPAPSISATTGAMEKHSPLFRESSANPQLSLF